MNLGRWKVCLLRVSWELHTLWGHWTGWTGNILHQKLTCLGINLLSLLRELFTPCLLRLPKCHWWGGLNRNGFFLSSGGWKSEIRRWYIWFPPRPRGSVGKKQKQPAKQETQVRSLGGEDSQEEGMATHSSILAWRIPWTEEPGGLESLGRQPQTRLKWLSPHARGLLLNLQWPPSCWACTWPVLCALAFLVSPLF